MTLDFGGGVIMRDKGSMKDQPKLEHIASRLSMEKGVSSVSWLGLEAEPTPE